MLGNKYLASFLTAFCLGLSVVQVRTLIRDKGDFFHPGNCSQSQVCRIISLHAQSSIAVWTHGNTPSLLDKPPLQVLPVVGTGTRATQGGDSESECGTALFPNPSENSCALVSDTSEGTELLTWLPIRTYMNLMYFCVQVSCPSKGTLIPCGTPLVSTIQSSWIVCKRGESFSCKQNSAMVINSFI